MDAQPVDDKIEIKELLYRYARAVDTKDWALLASVFTPDAYLDYTSAHCPAGSRDEIVGWHGCVVDEDVGRADLPDYLGHQSLAFIAAGDVGLDGDGLAAGGLDPVERLLQTADVLRVGVERPGGEGDGGALG